MEKNMKLAEHLASPNVAALSHSNKLDDNRLSPHFTLGEMTKTSTGLANVPNEAQVKNLMRLCGWLEMLRDEWNKRYSLPPAPSERGGVKDDGDPIIITSAFRSPAVNKAVGGVSTSNHLTGCAADIRVAGMEEALRKAVILLDISDESGEDFDELLIERNQRGSYWIHFAVRPQTQGNRRKVRFIHA